MDKVRVLIANRPRLMREVVRTALARHTEIDIAGEVEDELEVLPALEETKIQCLIVTQEEPDSRPAICDEVFEKHPRMTILAISPGGGHSVFYWMFREVRLSPIETSEEGVVRALCGDLVRQSLSSD